VNLSTGGAIYGETPRCADESRAVDPPSPYGRYKAEAEGLVAGSGLRAVTLRLANVYGPRQRTDLEGGVIAIFIGAWQRHEPITIYGDGSAERDYVYVSDVCDAVVSALGGVYQGLYNVGTGDATSVNTLVELLTALLGPPASVVNAPAREVEIQRACVDNARAARDGLWRPRTSLAEGLRLTATAG
jgi:UDP-glucose 4-epimerase